jgi:methylated-DNA-protein-cysteine methyltransferase related protein
VLHRPAHCRISSPEYARARVHTESEFTSAPEVPHPGPVWARVGISTLTFTSQGISQSANLLRYIVPMDTMFKLMLAQVRRIPHGKVATYGDVAYAAGFPGAARQAAWALHASAHDLPWHRVVGAGGKILCAGEMGFEQRMRLQAEGVRFMGLRVDMTAHHYRFFKSGKGKARKTATSRLAQARKAGVVSH